MVYRRKIYIITIILLIAFVTVMLGFTMKKDTANEYRGTLVHVSWQEAVV